MRTLRAKLDGPPQDQAREIARSEEHDAYVSSRRWQSSRYYLRIKEGSGAFSSRVQESFGRVGLLGVQARLGIAQVTGQDLRRLSVYTHMAIWPSGRESIRRANNLHLPGWDTPPDDPRFKNLAPLRVRPTSVFDYTALAFMRSVVGGALLFSTSNEEHDAVDHAVMQTVVRNSPLLTWCLKELCGRELAAYQQTMASERRPLFMWLTRPARPSYRRELAIQGAIARTGEVMGEIDAMTDASAMEPLMRLGPSDQNDYRKRFIELFVGGSSDPIADPAEILPAFFASVASLAAAYPQPSD